MQSALSSRNTSSQAQRKDHRIPFLDGLRGVSIILVILYHLLYRWGEILPYGYSYNNLLATYGFVGVQMFFMISGFVILMTLEKCSSFPEFITRRWLRLFPAMFLASIFIYLTAPIFSSRPGGPPVWFNLLPGLSLIQGEFWTLMLGFQIDSLEGVFWSLYVEFKFYVVAALIYYLGNKYFFSYYISACFTIWVVARVLTRLLNPEILALEIIYDITEVLDFKHFGWFAAGSFYYIFHKTKTISDFAVAFSMSLVASFGSLVEYNTSLETSLAFTGVSFIFAVSCRSIRMQALLSSRGLLFFGFVSYPLYLMHESVMVSSIIQLRARFESMPDIVLMCIPLLCLCLVAAVIAKYLEPACRKYLGRLVLGKK